MPAASTAWIHWIIKTGVYMNITLQRNNKILLRDKAALLIIDIQEKILPVMNNPSQVINNTLKLIKGFKVLNIPIFYTEQYPKGLGSTTEALLTVLDLAANNFQVNVAADAVSSRNDLDYKISLDRMRVHGAEVTTSEAILFELLVDCGTDEFSEISKIIK